MNRYVPLCWLLAIFGFVGLVILAFPPEPKAPAAVVEYDQHYYETLDQQGYDSMLAAYCDEYPDRELVGVYSTLANGDVLKIRTCLQAARATLIPYEGMYAEYDPLQPME